MPAEWESHSATWIFWPTSPEQYLYGTAGDFPLVREAFRRLIDVLCVFEPVQVGAAPEAVESVKGILGRRAEVHPIPLDDAWARDAAPTFVKRGASIEAVCWRFTGWGGRFGPVEKDADAARRVAGCMGLTQTFSSLAIEGGAIHSNGDGTILTTLPVLLDNGRNPGESREGLENSLCDTLGARRVIALPAGFDGDDTGGHIDVVAAFSPQGNVLLNDCTDTTDPNHTGTWENRQTLESVGLEIVPVPQPAARFSGDARLAYSYLNFYVCNGAVIVPFFGDSKDDYARGLLAEHFPDREIIPLEARPLYLGGGGIHCVTQQVSSV